MTTRSSWIGHKNKSSLVKEEDLLKEATTVDCGRTLHTRLHRIDYWDLRAALETLPDDKDFNFDCHANLFRITRIK